MCDFIAVCGMSYSICISILTDCKYILYYIHELFRSEGNT